MFANASRAAAPGPLMQDLRARTSTLHAATEELPLMRDLMSPEVDAATYRDYLVVIAGTYSLIEPRLHEVFDQADLERLWVRAKLPALECDLATLGLEAMPQSADRESRLASLVRGQADALGGLYVLEGATLGGRVIAQRLQRQFAGSGALPFHFLGTRNAPSPAEGWRQFGAALEDEVSAQGHARERVLCAAVGVFELVHQALSEARA